MMVDADEPRWESSQVKHHPPMPDQYAQQLQRQHAPQSTDEYLHHRLSGMFLNRPTATPNIAATHTPRMGRPDSQAQHFGAAPRTLSPLEPAHQPPAYTYSNYSRRGSITDPALHSSEHRPSSQDINLPIPTSNNVSRRGSIATIDASSRSPSPAPLAQTKPYDDPHYYGHGHSNALPPSSVYESYQRRHSIANAEMQQPASADLSRLQPGFHFPVIKEDKRGPFSAPSSPPPTSITPYPTEQQEGYYNRYPANEHYQPYPTHRRASQLVDEGNNGGPILGRRASLPVVGGVNRARDPYPTASDGRPQRAEHSREYPSGLPKLETPYSRSPELRVSHKLAERKRRKEMKELFEELRDSLPLDRNLKQSKWEILSKAVEYIGTLKQRDYDMGQEISALRSELARLRQGQHPPH